MKNFGFIPPIISPTDYFFGSGKLGSVDLNPLGDWRSVLPIPELQRKGNVETQGCVSFATLNCLEMLHKFSYKEEPNYSDRFLIKASDTNPQGGNTPKKVADTLRKYGAVQENDWPWVDSLEEYYKDIPSRLFNMAKEWLGNFSFGYEYVEISRIKDALKRSPLGIAVYAWTQNFKGEYIKLGSPNHYCVLVAYDDFDRPIIWDSYEQNVKILEKDYPMEFIQLYKLMKKENPIIAEYNKAGFFGKLWQFIRMFLAPKSYD